MENRRRLPHFYERGHPLFVTFRLEGSLPPNRAFGNENMKTGEAFVAMDRLLDNARSGPRYLAMPEIAKLVEDGIRRMDVVETHAWVIMPNHVHLLFTPNGDVSFTMRRLKGATARQANLVLGRTGLPFWQGESFDRIVRTGEEFGRTLRYIVHNPVTAGLAAAPESFRWSSAWAGSSPPQAEAHPTIAKPEHSYKSEAEIHG